MEIKNQNNGKLSAFIFYTLISFSHFVSSQPEFDGELILFPHLESEFNSNLDNLSSLDNDEYRYGVDLFATFEYDRLLFLGEYLLSKDEQEFERIQLGWLFDNNDRAWLGRFHNPIGFWNSHYHHGDYLEAAISRPAIAEFEDDGGLLPMHLAGILYEGQIEKDDHGLGYIFALAAGAELDHGALEAWNVLEPSATDHDISATINLYYEPELYAPGRYGVFANYSEIPVNIPGINEIRQVITGGYGNWESDPWHVLASIYYVHNKLHQTVGTSRGSFLHAYIQPEYKLSQKWTLFGRWEETIADKNDAYLTLFPEFTEDRLLVGIRFDVFNKNALKLEVSNNQNNNDDFVKFMLQWSAVF